MVPLFQSKSRSANSVLPRPARCALRLAVPERGDVVLRETVLDVPVTSKPAVTLRRRMTQQLRGEARG